MAASATDTPFRRLEVCLCQCLCSSEDACLPLCPRGWDGSIDAVALPELSEQKSFPPIIAPPTGIGPKTPSGVTGAGIAGLLIRKKENAFSGVLKAAGVEVDNPLSRIPKPRSPGAQLSIELPPANPQEELPKVE